MANGVAASSRSAINAAHPWTAVCHESAPARHCPWHGSTPIAQASRTTPGDAVAAHAAAAAYHLPPREEEGRQADDRPALGGGDRQREAELRERQAEHL